MEVGSQISLLSWPAPRGVFELTQHWKLWLRSLLQTNATILRLPRLGIAVLISTKRSWPIWEICPWLEMGREREGWDLRNLISDLRTPPPRNISTKDNDVCGRFFFFNKLKSDQSWSLSKLPISDFWFNTLKIRCSSAYQPTCVGTRGIGLGWVGTIRLFAQT